MGNILISEKCEPIAEGSIINLSDEVVNRVTKATPIRTLLRKDFPLEEEREFAQLRCMDEEHSKLTGISFEEFTKFVDILEKKIKSNRAIECQKEKLLKCLRHHQSCMITCKNEIAKYIDCIDATRIQIVKENLAKHKLEEAEREAKQKQPEVDVCPSGYLEQDD